MSFTYVLYQSNQQPPKPANHYKQPQYYENKLNALLTLHHNVTLLNQADSDPLKCVAQFQPQLPLQSTLPWSKDTPWLQNL